MVCKNAPYHHGGRGGIVARGIGGGGSSPGDRVFRYKKKKKNTKHPDSKMLLPSVLTIIFTPSKIIYPVIRHQRHVSVKSKPHEKFNHT